MKFRKPFLVFSAFVIVVSCKKDQATTSSMLSGKWSIVNEQWTWTNPLSGVFHDSIYLGKSGDYYEFTADGNLFAREGNYNDTGTYYLVNLKQIQIMYSNWNGGAVSSPGGVFGPQFTISVLTENSLILSSAGLTPDGPVSDSLTLKR
jgi:hypothetical protein